MKGEHEYDTALATARTVIVLLEEAPGMAEHEKLSRITFAVLEAVRRCQNRHDGRNNQITSHSVNQ